MKQQHYHSTGAYMAMVVIWIMMVVVIGLTIAVVSISNSRTNERQHHARNINEQCE